MAILLAKASGYKSKAEYERAGDVTHRLDKIKIPFLFVSTLDDPFFGQKVIPFDKCYDHIMIGVTRTGGHICYFEGSIVPS